jgi:hypothetical protein
MPSERKIEPAFRAIRMVVLKLSELIFFGIFQVIFLIKLGLYTS